MLGTCWAGLVSVCFLCFLSPLEGARDPEATGVSYRSLSGKPALLVIIVFINSPVSVD